MQVTLQVIHTTLFGWYASSVFVCTGHLTAAVAVHSFCNWMGLPDMRRMLNHRYCLLLLATLCGGVVAFVYSVGVILQPDRSGGGLQDLVRSFRKV